MLYDNARKRKDKMNVRNTLLRIGKFQSTLILVVIYAALWLPAGILSRLLADWLQRRPRPGSGWVPRPGRLKNPAHLRDPF